MISKTGYVTKVRLKCEDSIVDCDDKCSFTEPTLAEVALGLLMEGRQFSMDQVVFETRKVILEISDEDFLNKCKVSKRKPTEK